MAAAVPPSTTNVSEEDDIEKPFLVCSYNQVGDHDYVSPHTHRVFTIEESSDGSAVLSASSPRHHHTTSNQNQAQQVDQDHDGKRQQERDIQAFQQATNEVWNVYTQLYYGGEGVGSVFFKRPAASPSGSEQLSFAMEGIFGIHKSTTTTSAGGGGSWDSVHVVHIDPPNVKEGTCQYRIQSAVVLSMRPKAPNATTTTTTLISSILQKETVKVLKLQPSPSSSSSSRTMMMSSHLEHLGKLIEEVEIGFRSKLERIDIPQSLDILESMYDPQQAQEEMMNSSSRNCAMESSTADYNTMSRQWDSTTTRTTTGMSRIGAAMMEDIATEALRKKTKGNVFLDRMKAQQEAKEAQLAADHQDQQDTVALVLATTKSHLKSTATNNPNNKSVPTTPVSSPLTASKAALRRTIPGGGGLSPNPAASMSPTPEFLNFRNKLKKTGA